MSNESSAICENAALTMAQAISALSKLTSHEWANKFCELMRNYYIFQDAYGLWEVSPRMVKGIVRHPMLVIAMHEKHIRASKGYDEDVSETNLKNSFKEWQASQSQDSIISTEDIDRAVQYFGLGLSPIQAIQKFYAAIEDGEELSFDDAESIYGSSGTVLLVRVMAIAIIVMVIAFAILTYENLAKKSESEAAVETTSPK